MTDGQSWYSWLSFPFFAPLSGAVSQQISPHLYKGDIDIEADVIREAGSLGRQLGILTDAVLELAGKVDPGPAAERHSTLPADAETKDRTALEKLAVLAAQVEAIKERFDENAERDAERALERLRKRDAGGYRRLTERLQNA